MCYVSCCNLPFNTTYLPYTNPTHNTVYMNVVTIFSRTISSSGERGFFTFTQSIKLNKHSYREHHVLRSSNTQNSTDHSLKNQVCTGPCGSLVWVQVKHNNLFNKPTWNTYNINTCSCLNTYVLCTLHVLQLRTYSVRIFVVQLRLQDFDFLYYLLVNSSGDKTRVIGKESVWETGSSLGGREGKTGLTWNQNLEPRPCVRVWGSPRHRLKILRSHAPSSGEYTQQNISACHVRLAWYQPYPIQCVTGGTDQTSGGCSLC